MKHEQFVPFSARQNFFKRNLKKEIDIVNKLDNNLQKRSSRGLELKKKELSSEFCYIFKNTFFTDHLQWLLLNLSKHFKVFWPTVYFIQTICELLES